MIRTRLTAKLVQTLPLPRHGNKIHYDAPDGKGHDWTPGFGLRLTANGHRSFILNYSVQGRERRLTLGSPPAWTLLAARAEAAELRRRIDSGEDPLAHLQAAREAPTVRDLVDRFEREQLPLRRESTAREYRATLTREILPALGHLKVPAVTATDIDRLHQKLTARGAPYQANRCVALLSKLFSLAIRWKLRPDNPVKGVERNAEHARTRYLSAAELSRLLAVLRTFRDPQAAAMFKLLLLTGARRGEVLKMTWVQIDLVGGVWTKPHDATKQGREHRTPLSQAALTLLRDIRAQNQPSPWVFPSPRTGQPWVEIKKPWAEICRQADLKNLHIHDLRHSFAALLAGSGRSLPVIGALLGHSQPSTTNRYAHLADDPQRLAADYIGELVSYGSEREALDKE